MGKINNFYISGGAIKIEIIEYGSILTSELRI